MASAVDAMIDMVPSPYDNSQEHSVVEVRREEDTITEWDQNGDMIAAAFPSLFMRGSRKIPCLLQLSSINFKGIQLYVGRLESALRVRWYSRNSVG
ncbi:hypothetical protein PC116_g23646 [Phytophthora cactorum]|uniref:Uncharacterized protein n=1 Tax=Phytophthora cactorum TaxID=29920 RepID=A0A8T1BFM8_9STRA|nr:hypothetical protein PC111_g19453 [Phytophthora cactorum]KAG2807972.1 hypothetical protein PC112_g17170 [Phytophthora cactorum]KAG2836337.1 hypothetical protein PC113_g20045 [Phytophthora cactorum]KAG2880358.1 hypothetical protein PC114_g22109 [Phytophthora cactorum]KAG2889759.1 hypothetical protein PC115_g19661 [Phytophthora cactorum]